MKTENKDRGDGETENRIRNKRRIGDMKIGNKVNKERRE